MSRHTPRHRIEPLDEIPDLDKLLAQGGTLGEQVTQAARRAWGRIAHRHPPGRHRLNGGPPGEPPPPNMTP